jgi:hypothetical protein
VSAPAEITTVNSTLFSARHVNSRGSSASIVTRLRAGLPDSIPGRGRDSFLIVTASKPALGPTKPPIQWVLRSRSPGIKRTGREANHSPPPSAELRMRGLIQPLPYTSLWIGASLSIDYVCMVWYFVEHRDNFTSTT